MSTGFRSEPPHVAQQSRRDKLRVQPIAADHLLQVRDVYDPAVFSSAAAVLDLSAAHGGGHGFGDPSSSTAAGGGCDWSGGSLLPSHLYHARPCGFQDAPQTGELASQDPHGLQFSSSPYAHNTLQEVVASSTSNQGLGMAASLSHPWSDGGNRLVLLPAYANEGGTARIDNTSVWMSRQPQQWSGGEGKYSSATQQGLSLSLASRPPPPEFHVSRFEERFGHDHLSVSHGLHSSRVANEVGVAAPYPKFNANQAVPGSSVDVHRSAGPLGPSTGYATILKSSKFLKPAQQLLVEFCSAVTGVAASASAALGENDAALRIVNSAASSSSLQCLTGGSGGSGSGNDTCQVLRPEFQQKKAKLLLMQEEVRRRYKQYHQQMQMVVSAFESVASLSAATPYTSLALKSVSKHFRCIKNAIADHIRHIRKVLGEELMSSPSSSKGDIITTQGLKYIEQNLGKPSGDNSRFMDHNSPVWRPQRGLPERSVAVLRAWLFEHFLHPYPTDTDKHMLATQTGLSRNQVSNWFINARVRLWKPMVEEIHMLEMKGMAEMNLNSAEKNGKMVTSDDHQLEAQSSKPQSDCLSMASVPTSGSFQTLEQWHPEKRSRMECMVPGSMNGSLTGFCHDGMDIGGLGAVSLTLGLRHDEGAAGSHQSQPQQQHIPRHFGSQMVYDFGC